MAFIVSGQIVDMVSGRGLPGVAVSNGETVVRSDQRGVFQLVLAPTEHRFLFVVVPDGFRNDGTFFFSTASWTSPPPNLTFRLIPDANRAANPFSFAQVTDIHLQTGPNPYVGVYGERVVVTEAMVAEDLARVVEAGPRFIVVSGDLTHFGTPPQLEAFHRAMWTSTVPIFPMFGGHDGFDERYAETVGEASTRNFEAVFGPTYYSFDWGGWHIVLFPNEDGYFAPDEAACKNAWLHADLTAHQTRPTVLVTHLPPPREILDRLEPYHIPLVLYGHWHSGKAFRHGSTWVIATPPLSFGGIDTSPRGYRLVEAAGSGVTTRYQPLIERGCNPQSQPLDPASSASNQDTTLLGRRLRWQQRLPGALHRAVPLTCGDVFLASLSDGDGQGVAGICAIDLASGELRWHTRLDASIKNTVAVSGDTCVALSITGRLSALAVGTGEVRWQVELPGFPERWLYTSPVIVDGVVYAGGKQGFGAFDLTTGALRWHTSLGPGDTWSCYASPVALDDLIILLVARHGIVAFCRTDGKVAWEQDVAVDFPHASPLVIGDGVLVGAAPGRMVLLDGATGQSRRWQVEIGLGCYVTGASAEGECLYVVNDAGEVSAHRSAMGEVIWRYRTDEALYTMRTYGREGPHLLSVPAFLDDKVLVGGMDGCIYAFASDTGEAVAKSYLGAPVTTVSVAGDTILIGTYGGDVFCW